jgi:hypothetical protein
MSSGITPAVALEKLIESLNIHDQKPEEQGSYNFAFAIEEASESFARLKIATKKHIHSGKEFILVDKLLLNAEQRSLLLSSGSRKTKIPDIYVLMTPEVKVLPKATEEVDAGEKVSDAA